MLGSIHVWDPSSVKEIAHCMEVYILGDQAETMPCDQTRYLVNRTGLGSMYGLIAVWILNGVGYVDLDPLSQPTSNLYIHFSGRVHRHICMCCRYYMFRAANGEKDRFRTDPNSSVCAHLKYIDTARGTRLLVSGWWGLARKINYTGASLECSTSSCDDTYMRVMCLQRTG